MSKQQTTSLETVIQQQPPFPTEGNLAALQSWLQGLGSTLVPDKRLGVWDLSLAEHDGKAILSGYSTVTGLAKALAQVVGNYAQLQVQEIPLASMPQAAIVSQGFVNLRRESAHRAELMSQLLLGSLVKPLRYADNPEWVLVQHLLDGYVGWVHHKGLQYMDHETATEWFAKTEILPYPDQLVSVSDKRIRFSTPASVRLQRMRELRFRLPDGQELKPATTANQKMMHPGQQPWLPHLESFLGVPYLWGGNTHGGIDCSGLVQVHFHCTAFAASIPRDADQQHAKFGLANMPLVWQDLKPRQLLFFAEPGKKVTHVAIHVGQGLYIHADTTVRYNSLDPMHPWFAPERAATWCAVGHVMV